jgi:hypothetical protein
LEESFRAAITPDAQPTYFYDAFHPNTQGAALFSAWTADALVEWLRELYAG